MKFFISFLSLFALVSILSCGDACDDIDCGPNGTCDEGACKCFEGYEGEFCELELRERFVGTWTDTSPDCDNTDQEQFSYMITKGDDLYRLIMVEESSPEVPIKLTIGPRIDDNIAIHPQDYIGPIEIFNISGYGRFENDQIVIEIDRLSTHYPNWTCNLVLSRI